MAAEILVERGGPGDAMTALTKLQVCFKENPKDLDTLAVLARAFERLGQPSKAVAVQKEAARIAKETGRQEAFDALVDALLLRAPDDDGVRQLAAQRTAALRASSRPAASVPAVSSVEVDLDESEVAVDEVELVEALPSEVPPPVAPPAAGSVPFDLHPGQAAVTPDPAVRTRHLLQQAEQLRRGFDYERSTALLAGGLAEMPGNRELFDKLCDILIEAGEQGAAIEHMLSFAHGLATTGDVDGAARLLDEVLLLEADQPDALQMLASLGYAVPGPAYDQATAQAYGYADQQQPAANAPEQGYEPNAYQGYAPQPTEAYAAPAGYAEAAPQPYEATPLPSYDLEEVSAAEALSLSSPPVAADGFPAGQLDDPFAAEGYAAQDPYGQPVHEAPLPAFPIDDASQAAAQAAAYAAQPPVFEDRPSQVGWAETSGNQLDEEALEEVEFFASHGMFDEARNLLESELARLPNHPLLLDRMRELQAMSGEAPGAEAQSGARALGGYAPEPGDDRSFDIAASLDALDAIDSGSAARPMGDGDPHQISVESVFEQFKAGVAAQVADSDAATHYDLGVAYQEMGLLNDAINEFELAAREPERTCVCQSMIGMIHLSLGDVDAAIDAFIRGLHASHRTVDQELALTYEIGNAYEARGVPDQAVYYFQRAARIDPGYDDPRGNVGDRIRRLEPGNSGEQAIASGFENDEFASLLDHGKLP
jgi:tetratricopeptide (TPR) repeat protein